MPDVVGHLPRADLATLPTPLERGPDLPGGVRLWMKRDDLTGLGMGGNKARKLEFLCGEALAADCDALVTVGAAQSNHCRMTAAAGARLGLEVHLVLAGDPPETPAGNQLLAMLFGAQLHFTGADERHWGELEIAREQLVDELVAAGVRPYAIPMGGSTPVGTLGYVAAYDELMAQCRSASIRPVAIVHTSSSGGTHAGLVAGRALAAADDRSEQPEVLAIGVAKGVVHGMPDIEELASAAVELAGGDVALVERADIHLDPHWMGDDYAIPTSAGDDAIRWAARRGGWVLDRVYTGKGFAGLLGNAERGRWPEGSDVVFVHTGGMPAIFVPGGAPDLVA